MIFNELYNDTFLLSAVGETTIVSTYIFGSKFVTAIELLQVLPKLTVNMLTYIIMHFQGQFDTFVLCF